MYIKLNIEFFAHQMYELSSDSSISSLDSFSIILTVKELFIILVFMFSPYSFYFFLKRKNVKIASISNATYSNKSTFKNN